MGRQPRPLLPGRRAVMGSREAEFSQLMHEESAELANRHATYDVYLRVNVSDTNREPNESTLFVGRDPHQVRSLEDSGVVSSLDAESKQMSIRLEKPVWKPGSEIGSMVPVTDHRLCINCVDVLNYFCKYREERAKCDKDDKSRFGMSNCVIHHANLFSLGAQANIAKCHICNTLHRRLVRWDDLDHSQYEDFRIELAFPQGNRNDDDRLTFVMVRSDTKKEPVWNWSVLMDLRLWPKEKYMHYFQAPLTSQDLTPEEYESLSKDQLSDNSSTLTRVAVKSWVRKCVMNEDGKHVECNRQDREYFPSRLLDVEYATEKSVLRIVSPKDDPALFERPDRIYATLSHCWGSWGAAENPNLTVENLEERKTVGLSYDSLPQTFRDALKVASWLNIPFLWIDSLCIIQDSKSDWIHEASLMHHTYQSSTINISASHGTDSRSGLFLERDPLTVTIQQFQAPNIPRSWWVTRDNVFGWTTISPAFSRAWIHRERQLAPRILHFTSSEVVWECSGTDGSSFASETLPGGAPFKQLWNGDSKYQSMSTSALVKSKQGKQMTYALWNELCETFSTKELTVKSDMPIIMSSLAEEFHRSLTGDEYLAGMWKDTLPQALAWHTNQYWPEGDTGTIAPTWSWLSAPAPIGVSFVKKVDMARLVPLAKVVDVSIVRQDEFEDNAYGPVKTGVLTLEGFMRKIWFNFDEEGGGFEISVADTLVDGDEDDDEKTTLREIGRNWDEYEGEVCEVEFDGRIKVEEYCCWCMFTSIEEWIDSRDVNSGHREITAVLLERPYDGSDDDGGEDRWIRTGMMKMKDVLAFKMRYKACWDLESDPGDDENEEENEAEETKSNHAVAEHKNPDVEEDETQDTHTQLGETSNSPINTTPELTPGPTTPAIPEDPAPPPKQSPLHPPTNTSEPENNTLEPLSKANPESPSEPDPKSPSQSQSSDSNEDIWESFARVIRRDRFDLDRAERAVKRAHRDEEEAMKRKEGNGEQGWDGVVAEDESMRILEQSEQNATTLDLSPSPGPDLAPATLSHQHSISSNISISEANSDPATDPNPPSNFNPPRQATTIPDPSRPPPKLPVSIPIPIHGLTTLDPSSSLYQFDESIARLQREKGYFKFLRRLDVRRIEIV